VQGINAGSRSSFGVRRLPTRTNANSTAVSQFPALTRSPLHRRSASQRSRPVAPRRRRCCSSCAARLGSPPPACSSDAVKNIRIPRMSCGEFSIFERNHIRNPYTFVAVNRRYNEARAYNAMRARALLFLRLTDTNVYTEPIPLKYGKLATRYPSIYGYFLQRIAGRMPASFCSCRRSVLDHSRQICHQTDCNELLCTLMVATVRIAEQQESFSRNRCFDDQKCSKSPLASTDFT